MSDPYNITPQSGGMPLNEDYGYNFFCKLVKLRKRLQYGHPPVQLVEVTDPEQLKSIDKFKQYEQDWIANPITIDYPSPTRSGEGC